MRKKTEPVLWGDELVELPVQRRGSVLPLVLAVLLMAVGLAVCAYPFVSDCFYDQVHRSVVTSYRNAVDQTTDGEAERLLQEAQAYNARLAARTGRILTPSEEELAEYRSILAMTDEGILGCLDVPALHISLPIYHGTSDEVLQQGAGHLAGSSFPVEGTGVHAVLTGHSGLPSATLFTRLDRLREGDTFQVTVLRRTLHYQVDSIQVVLPSQVDQLTLTPGENFCTLVTCTPYGVNTHRLLVRGRLTEVTEARDSLVGTTTTVVDRVDRMDLQGVLKIAVPAVLVLLIAALLIDLLRRR